MERDCRPLSLPGHDHGQRWVPLQKFAGLQAEASGLRSADVAPSGMVEPDMFIATPQEGMKCVN
jgi:hypothetical protein